MTFWARLKRSAARAVGDMVNSLGSLVPGYTPSWPAPDQKEQAAAIRAELLVLADKPDWLRDHLGSSQLRLAGAEVSVTVTLAQDKSGKWTVTVKAKDQQSAVLVTLVVTSPDPA